MPYGFDVLPDLIFEAAVGCLEDGTYTNDR